MKVRVVQARHGGMIIAGMRTILHEVAIYLTVTFDTFGFQRLSRVTESVLHLHLGRACRCAFELCGVLRYRFNGVDINGSLSRIASHIEVVSI